ncbi:hypothetical protein LEMLEM_LOCUS24615 [Lemmus lemmus]
MLETATAHVRPDHRGGRLGMAQWMGWGGHTRPAASSQ